MLRDVTLPLKEIDLNQHKGCLSHIWMFIVANNVHKGSLQLIAASVHGAA